MECSLKHIIRSSKLVTVSLIYTIYSNKMRRKDNKNNNKRNNNEFITNEKQKSIHLFHFSYLIPLSF